MYYNGDFVQCLALGLGHHIVTGHISIASFARALGRHDLVIVESELGSYTGQQSWECLAIAAVIKLWSSEWEHVVVQLRVRGDNMSALCMIRTLMGNSRGTNNAHTLPKE